MFHWEFSESTNGVVIWNGITGWAGGHYWQIAISNLTLVPRAQLSIASLGAGSVQIGWATNFTDYVLEYAPALSSDGWNIATNAVTTRGNRHTVSVDADAACLRFYRLRKLGGRSPSG